MIAILESYRAGLLVRANLWRNVMAGCIVGVVALPLAMAFAIASGARPEQGLYTAIVAGLLFGITAPAFAADAPKTEAECKKMTDMKWDTATKACVKK